MAELSTLDHDEVMRRLRYDLEDSYDEELELEIEDRDSLSDDAASLDADKAKEQRRRYFHHLEVRTHAGTFRHTSDQVLMSISWYGCVCSSVITT